MRLAVALFGLALVVSTAAAPHGGLAPWQGFVLAAIFGAVGLTLAAAVASGRKAGPVEPWGDVPAVPRAFSERTIIPRHAPGGRR